MFLSIVIFILGLVVGSFLNVVILRLKKKKSFLCGRSFCPLCKHGLATKDLIPLVSFFVQKGRCRYCKKKISWQYPLVELAAGICFLLVWQHYLGLEVENITQAAIFIIRDLIFTSFLIVIFVFDLKYYLILDKVSIPLMVLALILNVILGFQILNLLFAGLVAGGFFLLQYLVSRGKWIGGGDIRLGIVMGLMLGWPYAVLALFMAYLIGFFVAMVLLVSGKKKWGSEVPLGTFLSIATFVSLLYGEIIWQSYWQWVG